MKNDTCIFHRLFNFPVYQCGNGKESSDVSQFTSLRTDAGYSPTMAFYGDLGTANPQSLSRLQQDIIKGMYDVILHVGKLSLHIDYEENLFFFKTNV